MRQRHPSSAGRRARWRIAGVAAALLAVAFAFAVVVADAPARAEARPAPPAPAATAEGERPEISGDPSKPRRHFRLRNPAQLEPAEAERVYRGLAGEMAAGYRLSGDPVAKAYSGWRRYNIAPYRSATHGNRYLNNYANARARAYGRFEAAGRLPVGSVIAKDSFTVTEDGAVHPGPLFIMEKMPAGFKYVTGDWRYGMIMPDGSVFGVTDGLGAQRVEFCIACHLAREELDHLYFIPEEYRAPPRG